MKHPGAELPNRINEFGHRIQRLASCFVGSGRCPSPQVKHDKRTGHILQKRLIDRDRNLLLGHQTASRQTRANELFGQIKGHRHSSQRESAAMRLERTGPLGGSSFYFIPFQLAFKDYPGAKGSRFSDEAYRIKLFDEAKARVGKLEPRACVGTTTRMALRCPRCTSAGDHRHADNNAGCFQADGPSHRAAQPAG